MGDRPGIPGAVWSFREKERESTGELRLHQGNNYNKSEDLNQGGRGRSDSEKVAESVGWGDRAGQCPAVGVEVLEGSGGEELCN